MTNTETVSTERLAFLRLWAEQSEDEITLKASEVRELLASRTQSPAEWQVERAAWEYWRATTNPAYDATWHCADLDESVKTKVRDGMRAALRAAAITPPAPERSKEGTVEAKIEAFVSYGPLRSYDHEKLMDRVLGPALESLEEVRDTRGNLTGWNIVISALETPPLHKEGEAVSALRDAIAWIVEAPHDEHCFTNDPNPDACRCVCGKDSILDRLYEAEPPDDKTYEDAPVPVPVTITDEMVERAAKRQALCAWDRFNAADSPFAKSKYPNGAGQYVAEQWRLYEQDARHVLTAALSQKPGEQGK